jgi:hypothetical protein
MAIEIYKDSNVIDVVVASARKESLDSEVRENANKLIKDLASDPTPHNRYQIAQIVRFAANDIVKRDTNWLDLIADTKRVGYGDKAAFDIKLNGVRAFIQAKGATTPRTKNGRKSMSMETIAVSARPVVNIVEMQNGLANMADLVNDASYQMECQINKYVQGVLTAGASAWSAPYYGTGSGLVKATLDPMILHWLRIGGGATVLGDVGELNKLAALTGFTSTTNTQQFADQIIVEQNAAAFIGTYLGAKAIQLVNPLMEDGTDNFVFDDKKLYILPNAVDPGMRPLKVVFEGDIFSIDNTNIDDLSYEVRLDQYFNAAIAYGDRPYMGVYADSST